MIRLFISQKIAADILVLLDEKQHHYLCRVMRLKDGDTVSVFNSLDGEWEGKLKTVSKKETGLLPVRQIRAPLKTPDCILCPALIKKENMDLVIQKATELGATQIRPVITDHTAHRSFNLARARLIAIESAEQCERLDVPDIYLPQPLLSFLKEFPADKKLVYLSERGQTSGNGIGGAHAFLIGPEGGFSPAEIKHLAGLDFAVPLHLGDRILRAETASIAVLSCMQFAPFLNTCSKKVVMG
ncbi:MAG: 16S rRNA (uracil(1498)-N(3))-methyltransferase [Lactobacillales bacterium]|jgi:16S rRNA (uracil1498-N3)-methyltransferase|nr:16S rRNA (uracil(1498)-N(3))-methyltransferase [Lactobacillales bacterium]